MSEEQAVEITGTNETDINALIDAIAMKNYNQAQSHFEDVLGAKMSDALDQEKIAVADTIYNGDIDDGIDEPEDEVAEVDEIIDADGEVIEDED